MQMQSRHWSTPTSATASQQPPPSAATRPSAAATTRPSPTATTGSSSFPEFQIMPLSTTNPLLIPTQDVRIIFYSILYLIFQHILFLRITTLVSWLNQLYYWRKNALIHIFIRKHNAYKQIRHSIIVERKMLEERGG